MYNSIIWKKVTLASLLLACLLTQWANSIDLPSLARLLSFDCYGGSSLSHWYQSLTVLTGDASEGTCIHMHSLTGCS